MQLAKKPKTNNLEAAQQPQELSKQQQSETLPNDEQTKNRFRLQ